MSDEHDTHGGTVEPDGRDGAFDEARGAMESLSPRVQMFVSQYLSNGFRPLEAAQAVGMAWTKDALSVWACKQLHKPAVQAVIRAHLAAVGLTRERVLAELAEMALARLDLADLEPWFAGEKSLKDLRDECGVNTVAIDSVQQSANGTRRAKLRDRGRLLETLLLILERSDERAGNTPPPQDEQGRLSLVETIERQTRTLDMPLPRGVGTRPRLPKDLLPGNGDA